jgi:hypothetical protein
VRLRSTLANIVNVLGLSIIALSTSPRSLAGEQSSDLPIWLKAHVGEGAGQIAPPVLKRARSLYLQKLRQGVVRNRCYFAMDATRPSDRGSGGRFYVICEAERAFHAVSAGHGSGRALPGVADFSNGRRCARNFGNAMDSALTAGGVYVTGETKTSFKGYYSVSANKVAALLRTFIQFDGEGETANARQRAIGGHASVALKGICLQRKQGSPYANLDGYVPFGKLVDYTGGRSNGCTTWSPSDAKRILGMVQNDPTTLYIYPDAADINAVARAVAAGQSPSRAGLYWNASCLSEIRAPKFWSKRTLEPIISRYERVHPAPPSSAAPICARL